MPIFRTIKEYLSRAIISLIRVGRPKDQVSTIWFNSIVFFIHLVKSLFLYVDFLFETIFFVFNKCKSYKKHKSHIIKQTINVKLVFLWKWILLVISKQTDWCFVIYTSINTQPNVVRHIQKNSCLDKLGLFTIFVWTFILQFPWSLMPVPHWSKGYPNRQIDSVFLWTEWYHLLSKTSWFIKSFYLYSFGARGLALNSLLDNITPFLTHNSVNICTPSI